MTLLEGTKALEAWCEIVTRDYSAVKIRDMTDSWRSGLGFCALIHRFRPDLLDFSSLNPEDAFENNGLAFRVAETRLGINSLLDPRDMVEAPFLDRLSILTYLSQFYQVFGGKTPGSGVSLPSSPSPPSSASSTPIKRISPSEKEPCRICKKPVLFILERFNISGKVSHRTCFKCARCGSQLSLANYYETENGDFCCEMCPDEEISQTQVALSNKIKMDAVSAVPDNSQCQNNSLNGADTPENNESLTILEEDEGLEFISSEKDETPRRIKEVEENEKTIEAEQEKEGKPEEEEIPVKEKEDMVKEEEVDEKSADEKEVNEKLAIEEEVDKTSANEKEADEKVPIEVEIENKEEEKETTSLCIVDSFNADGNEEEINNEKIEETNEKIEETNEKIEETNEKIEETKEKIEETKEKIEEKENTELLPICSEEEKDDDKSEVEYPEDLNPFDDDKPEISLGKSPKDVKDDENKTKSSSTNPFGSDFEDDNDGEKTSSKSSDYSSSVPPPKPPRAAQLVSLNPFGSDFEESDDEKSLSQPRSVSPSPSMASCLTIRSRKKRRAPLPPGATPTPAPRHKSIKERDNINRRSQISQLNFSVEKVTLTPLSPDKAEGGQWKKKKGPAPPRPLPPKRQVRKIPRKAVNTELADIEIKQLEFERQGVKLEKNIRELCEKNDREQKDSGAGSTAEDLDSLGPEVEDLIIQLFELVNEKNELFRRQTELMYIKREHRLEEEHADLEYQIRILMNKDNLSDEQKKEEEGLISRLMAVVAQRNEIVDCLEMDRLRELEEDESIETHMGEFAAVKTDETLSEKKKKKKKKNKEKKNKSFDVDKDIDTKEFPNLSNSSSPRPSPKKDKAKKLKKKILSSVSSLTSVKR